MNHESRPVKSNPEHVRNMIITYGHFVTVVVGTGRVLSFELGYIGMPKMHWSSLPSKHKPVAD